LLNPQLNRTCLIPATLNNSFFLGSINAVSSTLPITLLSFSAIVANAEVLLNWSTSLEINNADFTVQRSNTGTTWEDVVKVPGSTNSSSIHYYTAYDPSPYNGLSYYRLLQTDLDGKQTWSTVCQVNLSAGFSTSIYPNPAVDRVTIRFPASGTYRVSLFNSIGQEMFDPVSLTGNTLMLPVPGLAKGIYFIHIDQGSKEESIRLVIRK
jgi:hypothetical protein